MPRYELVTWGTWRSMLGYGTDDGNDEVNQNLYPLNHIALNPCLFMIRHGNVLDRFSKIARIRPLSSAGIGQLQISRQIQSGFAVAANFGICRISARKSLLQQQSRTQCFEIAL